MAGDRGADSRGRGKGRGKGSRRKGRVGGKKGGGRPAGRKGRRTERPAPGDGPGGDDAVGEESQTRGLNIDYTSLALVFLGLMAMLWAIAPPSLEGTQYRTEMRWVMLAVGSVALGIFAYRFRKMSASLTSDAGDEPVSLEFLSDEEYEAVVGRWTVGRRFVYNLTLSGALLPYMPYFGIALIAADVVYNLTIGDGVFRTFDTLVLLFGVNLAVYNYIPQKFFRERDFALLFMGFMCLLLVYLTIFIADPLLAQSRGGEANVRDDPNVVIQYLLAEPVAAFLRLFGLDVTAEGEIVTYENRFDDSGQEGSVWIGYACSGVYSISIFLSMYISYLMSEYRKFTRRMAFLIGMGVLMAYVANILRMSLIIVAGIYYGPEALYWTHKEVGWMLFMGWVFLFWWGSNRVLARGDG